jgi:hypothetical protein
MGTSAGDGQAARHLAKLIHASNEAQGECLRLIVQAERRMVLEIEDGQARGEVAQKHDGPTLRDHVRSTDMIVPATFADLGLDRRRVREWRVLASVPIEVLEEAICLALLESRAPTYEEILRAARAFLNQAASPPGAPRPGRLSTPGTAHLPALDSYFLIGPRFTCQNLTASPVTF